MEVIKYEEYEWRRTFVFSRNDGGWVIGEQDGWYVVSLDHGGLIMTDDSDLAY